MWTDPAYIPEWWGPSVMTTVVVFVSSGEIRTLSTETLGYNVGFMRIVGV